MMKRIPVIILSLLSIISIAVAVFLYVRSADTVVKYQSVTEAAELDALLGDTDSSPILIDLRDRKDYTVSHIPNFLNIAYDDGGATLKTWIAPFNRNKPVILVCYAGNRSARAFETLVLMGFRNITDFSSGYDAYVAQKGTGFVAETGSCDCPE